MWRVRDGEQQPATPRGGQAVQQLGVGGHQEVGVDLALGCLGGYDPYSREVVQRLHLVVEVWAALDVG
jgi:hypothetical protein